MEGVVRNRRGWGAAALLIAMCSVGACTDTPARGEAASAPGRSAPPPSDARPADIKIPAAAPATAADLFPPGPGRDAVLNNCGSCPNLACSAIGQRAAEIGR